MPKTTKQTHIIQLKDRKKTDSKKQL